MRITPLNAWIAGKVGHQGELLTRSAIQAWQLNRLRETLALVREKSAFYREHLSAAPTELGRLDDLAQCGFTTPEDIAREGQRMLCVSQGEIERVVTLDSSGTTGAAKRLFFTREDQELTIDFFGVGMSTLVEPGDRVLILLPCERPGSVGDLLAKGLERQRAYPLKHGPVRDLAETLQLLAQEKVDALVGVPVQVLALARQRNDQARRALRLQSALLSTDYLPPAIAVALEEAWGCRVFDHYGMTEMGLGGGVQCEARRGYHLREADLYVEVVDPATGREVPEGEYGEVVFTTLTRRGMPLIRYRTGDLSRFIPERCACGTALRSLEPVRQRLSGRAALGASLTLSQADLDDALFPFAEVLDVRAELSHQGDRDHLSVLVRTVPGAGNALRPRLKAALWSVPALAEAQSRGVLDLALQVDASGYAPPLSAAKRAIKDTRGPTGMSKSEQCLSRAGSCR
ncbi:MAG TPA: AMP-binding protein [Anaerolineae bacterium]|nr:AMP-binding protein [Anaerolineae bacterium]HQJ52318.1 AMP-binding protein [Anaerolineae bacterium]